MTWIAPLLAVLLAAVVAGQGALRRTLALLLAASALCAPYLHPDQSRLVCALVGLAAAAALMRIIDLLVLRRPVSAVARVVHVLSVADSFHVRRVRPRLALLHVVRMIAFGALAVGAWAVAFDVADGLGGACAHYVVRWLGGAAFVYATLDAVFALITFLYFAAGWDPGVLHRDPALARSIRELWGVRWSRLVSGWLGAHVFRPLARRGRASLGLAMSFVVSGALHAYATDPALGFRWAAPMGAFFLLQGVFAWLEGPLRVLRWPAWAGHAWTVAVMLGTSPLFSEAALRVLR